MASIVRVSKKHERGSMPNPDADFMVAPPLPTKRATTIRQTHSERCLHYVDVELAS
jgi:hypothetical protein